MAGEPVARSLAQLHLQRGRVRQPSNQREPSADALGQFGLLFEAPAAEPDRAAAAEPERAAPVDVARGVAAMRLSPAGAVVNEAGPEPVDGRGPGARPERVRATDGVLPDRRRDDAPWTVGELVSTLRGRLENHGTVWVAGEICNWRPAQSGHVYFTLKDGDAQLGAVLFRRQAALLRWQPGDGAAVLLRGRLSVFEGRGQLQLIAETLELRGAGALQAQFERLKEKLRAEGLFDAERKRPLPAFPRRVGVVTSVQGAVIRDIVTVCRRRHGCMNLLVYPAAVQGAGAPAEIAAGIRYLNRMAELSPDESGAREDGGAGGGSRMRARLAQVVDVIVIARGGGSAEDLAAFNDEGLARAIAGSALPVVSAVGHETDFTIADFVADLRAPTPSAAAEMITESQHRVEERLQALAARLYRAVRFQQVSARQRFLRLAVAGVLRRTQDGIERRQQRLDLVTERLERAAAGVRRGAAERLRQVEARLGRRDVRARLREERLLLATQTSRLTTAAAGMLVGPRHRLERATARLLALSPLAVLDRGYALAFTGNGTLVRSAAQLREGDTLVARFAAGRATTRVTDLQQESRGKEQR